MSAIDRIMIIVALATAVWWILAWRRRPEALAALSVAALVLAGGTLALRIAGIGLRAPKNPVPGYDLAGRVEAVGANVTRFRPRDEVFGTCRGSFAEYASTRSGRLAPKPANVSFEQAAAVPISDYSALQAVRDRGKVRPGQRS